MSTAQRAIKYIALALAISIIGGIISSAYYFIENIGSIFVVETDNNGLNIKDYSDDAKILSIDISSADLKIVEGKKFDVKTKNEYIIVKKTDNKLFITEDSHSIFNKAEDQEVIVYIPSTLLFDEVYIENNIGRINIDKLLTKKLNLSMSIGKIQVDKLSVLNDFNIDNNIGSTNINMLNSKEDYTINSEMGIGTIKIDGKKIQDETKYGKGNNNINIDGGIGNIDINFKN